MKKGTTEWLEFANRDLEAARILLNSSYLANVVLFHSQQCIEKCLKAYLEENAIRIPKIHSNVGRTPEWKWALIKINILGPL